jgi:hypothetical protein
LLRASASNIEMSSVVVAHNSIAGQLLQKEKLYMFELSPQSIPLVLAAV